MANKYISILIGAKNMTARGIAAARASFAAFGAHVKSVFSAIQKHWLGLTASIAAVNAVVGLAVKKTIEAYNTQARAEAKLQATLKATGYAAGFTSSELIKYAAELQKTVGAADEVVISAMGILASFRNIKGDMFKQATLAIIDMSANLSKAGETSEGVESAVIQVGKALNDPIKGMAALGRIGIQFTKGQRDQITALQESGRLFEAQQIILAELQGEFGGVAKAMYEADSGMKRLSNSWGDFKEAVGKAIVENAKMKSQFDSISEVLEKLASDGYIELFAQDLASAAETGIRWLGKWAKAVIFMTEQMERMTGVGAVKAIRDALTGGGSDAIKQTKDERLAEIRKRREEQQKEDDEKERSDLKAGQRDMARMDAEKRMAEERKRMAEETKRLKEANEKAAQDEADAFAKAEEEKADAAKKTREEWLREEQRRHDDEVDAYKDLVDRKATLAQQLAAEEKRLAKEATADKLTELQNQLQNAQAFAKKTVQAIIDEARDEKKKEEVRDEEKDRADKLTAKQARGVRLSKRDREWIGAFKEREKAIKKAGELPEKINEAQKQLAALDKNTGKLGEIKTELEKTRTLMEQLMGVP